MIAGRWRLPRDATKRLGMLLLLSLVLLGIAAPRVVLVNGYLLDVARLAFYLAALACTWSLIAGIAGQFSFAHVAVAGGAGYAAAIWSREVGAAAPALGAVWIAIVAGTCFAALIGLVLAGLLGRLRGAYLALFTIAFGEIVHTIVVAETDLTGGSIGIVPPQLPGSDLAHYYVMLGVLGAELATVYWIMRSRTGLLLRAMREDVDAAAAMGVQVRTLKRIVLVLTAVLAGLAGAVYASTVPRIGPDSVDLLLMTQVIAFAIIGGLESPLAAAIAAVTLTFFLEESRSIDVVGMHVDLGVWRYAFFGAVLVVTLRSAPDGLLTPVLRATGGREARLREAIEDRAESVGARPEPKVGP